MPTGTYASTNEATSIELFYQRFIYRNSMLRITENNPHFVNFNFGEKFMFGRVDRFSSPIIIKNTPIRKAFKTRVLESSDASVEAMDFVVDAFHDMVKSFEMAMVIGQIAPESPFLGTLKVHKSYENPRAKYKNYNDTFNIEIYKQFLARNIQVLDFKQFTDDLKGILLTSGEGISRFPYTLPAFIKSRLCPITCSGLAIELASLDASNDNVKVSFINDTNWNFFLNACNDHGFMVDQNVPWRIVADIDTPVMLERAGAATTTGLIRGRYRAAYLEYYRDFKFYLLNLYNKIKQNVYRQVEFCQDGTIINRLVYPREYTVDDLTGLYGEEFFIDLYCQIRFAEEESVYTQNEKESLIHQTTMAYRADADLLSAIFIFERILNKSFDYSRSVSYIVNRRKLLKDAGWKSEHFKGDTHSGDSDMSGGGGY